MASNGSFTFDVLVVGAGPAGMAAAVCAAESGARTGLVDENFRAGGQIWRSGLEDLPAEAKDWIQRCASAGVTILCGMRVVDQLKPGVLIIESMDGAQVIQYQQLVLATGARERFLPFPGWTLPNVMGAGGLQAMVKSGLSIQGKRVVVAGTGPLLLAVAAYLRKHGARVLMICEQASWMALARFAIGLLGKPAKVAQAMQLKRELKSVPFIASSWPVAAGGSQVLETVTISRRGKLEKVACDYLACGFHLVPNSELATLLGCKLENDFVQVDALQRTSVPGVFCAGEPTGIGGVELALVEGQIAGFAASGNVRATQALITESKKLKKFAAGLERTFQLRNNLQSLAEPDTLVCRCEDISYARLERHRTWRSAKLQTRCGMGACQGRICGPATQFLFDWTPDSVRPPIFPARVESLAGFASCPEPTEQSVVGGH
jgi:D-hydroxyproline dehydrogenase subunit alpha